MPDYAVIALGGKQYRVREGERLLVDRLPQDEGASFEPRVLATGDGDGIADGGAVTATVEEHLLGKKILVFTYKPKRNSRRRRAVKLCGAVSVVTTLGPRRRSCSGTQNRSAVLADTRGSSRMMV